MWKVAVWLEPSRRPCVAVSLSFSVPHRLNCLVSKIDWIHILVLRQRFILHRFLHAIYYVHEHIYKFLFFFLFVFVKIFTLRFCNWNINTFIQHMYMNLKETGLRLDTASNFSNATWSVYLKPWAVCKSLLRLHGTRVWHASSTLSRCIAGLLSQQYSEASCERNCTK